MALISVGLQLFDRHRHPWVVSLAAGAVLLGLATCGGDGAGDRDGVAGGAGVGTILFASDRDGNKELYSVKSDGSGLTNLTNHPAEDGESGFNEERNFDWSPNGERIAFGSHRDGATEIYIMNRDGSGQTRVSTTGRAGEPRWSPDGLHIAFAVQEEDSFRYVYVVGSDGTGETRLHRGSSPDWSPDGEEIVFEDGGIYVMKSDGTGVRALVDTEDQYFAPFWSPGGSRILFSAYKEGDNGSLYSQIFVVDSDGSNLAGLPPGANNEDHYSGPAWSPDGEWIVYSSDVEGLSLYTMSVDGSNVARLSKAVVALKAEWSPDGSRLAFVGLDPAAPSRAGVFVMNVDGSGVKAVATNAVESSVAWSPVVEAAGDQSRTTPLRPGTPSPSPTPTPKAKLLAKGQLAFTAAVELKDAMYLIAADGSGAPTAIPGSEGMRDPTLSPDGKRLAFSSNSGEPGDYDVDIFVMNTDGSGRVRITDIPPGRNDEYEDRRMPVNEGVAWSPNGRWIAFLSYDLDDFDGNGSIYLVEPDGSGLLQLTDSASQPMFVGTVLSWSPGSDRIAFVSGAEGQRDISLINADGSGLINLTDDPGDYYWPAWSPDGKQIAFVSRSDEGQGDFDVYVVSADGTGRRRLADTREDDWQPTWSPDGQSLIFVADYGSHQQLYSINADGSGLNRLTNDDDREKTDLRWSPDGRTIAFAALDEDDAPEASGHVAEIRVMNRDGSGVTQVYRNLDGVSLLAYLPD